MSYEDMREQVKIFLDSFGNEYYPEKIDEITEEAMFDPILTEAIMDYNRTVVNFECTK